MTVLYDLSGVGHAQASVPPAQAPVTRKLSKHYHSERSEDSRNFCRTLIKFNKNLYLHLHANQIIWTSHPFIADTINPSAVSNQNLISLRLQHRGFHLRSTTNWAKLLCKEPA